MLNRKKKNENRYYLNHLEESSHKNEPSKVWMGNGFGEGVNMKAPTTLSKVSISHSVSNIMHEIINLWTF